MKHNESTENSDVTVKPRYPNLKPFKPGQSGNPGGRPKGKVTSKIENILDEKVARDKEGRTYLDKLARSIVDRAIKKAMYSRKKFSIVWMVQLLKLKIKRM